MYNIADYIDQINWLVWFKMLVQIFIICYAVLWFWRRIAGTHAERLVKGIMVLIAIALASWGLQLTLITSMLQHIIPAAALALVIVFQPEIRRGLGYLGRVQTFKFDLSLSNTESTSIKRGIDQIIAAVRELSRTRGRTRLFKSRHPGQCRPFFHSFADDIFSKIPAPRWSSCDPQRQDRGRGSDPANDRQSQTQLQIWHAPSGGHRSFRNI
jgi:hypothetical protein